MHVLYNLDGKFNLCIFKVQQFKLLQNFENATFHLVSVIKLYKTF